MKKKSKFTQMILGISTVALSFGGIQTQVSAEENTPYNVLQKKPIGIETSTDEIAHSTKADETLSYEERLKVRDFSQGYRNFVLRTRFLYLFKVPINLKDNSIPEIINAPLNSYVINVNSMERTSCAVNE